MDPTDAPAPDPGNMPPPRRRPSLIPIGIMAILVAAGLFMLWRGSFRRPLDDSDLGRFLGPAASEGDTHHALEEMSRRIARNDPDRKRYYPAVVAIASSPNAAKRRVVAWLMGEDLADEGFRAALLGLVADPVPMVTHNAALALARHGSSAARPVLLQMLRPSEVNATADGVFHRKAKIGETASLQTPLGTITTASGTEVVDTPVEGRVLALADEGAQVTRGATIATLSASPASANQALRALVLPGIGLAEDAAAVDGLLKAMPDLPDQVKDQARATLSALQARSGTTPR